MYHQEYLRTQWSECLACPMNHMLFFTLWRNPSYVAKLQFSLLTAVSLFSKWGMLLITGLSATWEKMIVYDSLHFPHAILCPLVYPPSCHYTVDNMAMIVTYH